MRLLFGLLFLFAGIWALAAGANAWIQLQKISDAFGPNAAQVWGQQYVRSFEEAQNMSYMYMGGGVIAFIIGLYLLMRRSRQTQTIVVQQPQYQPAYTPPPVAATATTTTTAPQSSLYDQLEKLGKLKEQGVLTEEEFQKEKRRILS